MRRAKSWFGLLLVVVSILMAEPPVMAQSQSCGEYVFAAGDTLFRIAQSYGLTVNDIAAANNIADPSAIFSGQRLTIPCAGANQPAASSASLLPISIQNVSQLQELYHRNLDTMPIDLGV